MHNSIVKRLVSLLDEQAENSGCQVYFTGIRVAVSSAHYRSPGVVVTAEDIADDFIVRFPRAIFEVLEAHVQDTEALERLEEYLRIPSMQFYGMVRQDRRCALVYARQLEGWAFSILGSGDLLDMPCIGAKVALAEVYADE
jgi:Uma2 family endonuclease